MNRFLYVSAFASLSLSLATAACGSTAENDGAESAATDATTQAIENGDQGSDVPGVLSIFGYVKGEPKPCSAVLLTNTWFITARHCLESKDGSARMPVESLYVQDDHGAQSGVMSYELHPSLDVAVVRLKRPWEMNGQTTGFRRSITTAATQNLFLAPVYCAGWGEHHPNDTDVVLRHYSTVITYTHPDGDSFIVSRTPDGKVQRPGDSGGGCFDNFGTLYGITSYGDDYAAPTYASLVSAQGFREWAEPFLLF